MSTTPHIPAMPAQTQAPAPSFRDGPLSQELSERQASFAAALGRQLTAANPAAQTPEAKARDGAEQFVTETFVLPLLKQLRESDHTPPPFGPSEGEKQFRALGDVELARRIVHAAKFPLVDRVARDLLKRSGKDSHGRDAEHEFSESRAAPARPTPGVPFGADQR
jgi:hypothetical protein